MCVWPLNFNCLLCFSFLVSVIYSKAKLASACGGIIYFLSYVPYMYVAIREEVAHDKITAFEKCIAVRWNASSLVVGCGVSMIPAAAPHLQALMSTTAFGLGSKYFALYEVAGVGIQWRTISQSPVEGDDFNLGLSMMMLIIDAAVYGVLTWYIEAVHPGESSSCPGSSSEATSPRVHPQRRLSFIHHLLVSRVLIQSGVQASHR